jgi:RecA-family ATPase
VLPCKPASLGPGAVTSPASEDTMLNFALQQGVRGTLVPIAGTFESFVRGLRSEVESEYDCDLANDDSIDEAKRSMVAFVPARFDAGDRRHADNVKGSTIIGLDIDGCPPEAWAGAVERLRAGGVSAVAHTSPTDGLSPGIRKGRIFVELDREATPAEVWPLRCAMAEALGVREWLDNATSDASRIFFAGHLRGTPPREFVVTGAQPLPPAGLLARFPHVTQADPAPTTATADDVRGSAFIWPAGPEHEQRMTPGIVGLIRDEYDRGGRHVKCRALGAVLAQSGWSDSGIAALVRELPSDRVEQRVEQALDAARLARNGERVHQRGALETAFGARLARHVLDLAEQPDFAAMRAAADAAAPPTAADPDAWGEVVRIDDLKSEIEPVNHLVEGLAIAPGAPTIFAGYGGLGKSMLVQLLVVCVASGRGMLRTLTVRQGRVLHLDYEQGRRLTSTRYKRIAAPFRLEAGALRDTLEIVHSPRVNLLTPGFGEALLRRTDGVALCVIDSLRAAAPGLDENDSRMREPLDMLLRVSEKTGCSFVVIHHARKQTKDSAGGNQEMRGTGAINDAAQTVVMLEAPPMIDDEPAYAGFSVVAGKVRDGKKFQPIGVEIVDADHEGVPFKSLDFNVIDAAQRKADANDVQLRADMAAVFAVVAAAPGERFAAGLSALEVVAETACGGVRARVRRAIAKLKAENRLTEESVGGRKTVYITPGAKAP